MKYIRKINLEQIDYCKLKKSIMCYINLIVKHYHWNMKYKYLCRVRYVAATNAHLDLDKH